MKLIIDASSSRGCRVSSSFRVSKNFKNIVVSPCLTIEGTATFEISILSEIHALADCFSTMKLICGAWLALLGQNIQSLEVSQNIKLQNMEKHNNVPLKGHVRYVFDFIMGLVWLHDDNSSINNNLGLPILIYLKVKTTTLPCQIINLLHYKVIINQTLSMSSLFIVLVFS